MNGFRKLKKFSKVQLLRSVKQAVHTSSLILLTHVKLNAHKNYATVEIHLKGSDIERRVTEVTCSFD